MDFIWNYITSNTKIQSFLKPFTGEGSHENPTDFTGRALLLKGQWQGTDYLGREMVCKNLEGDWPYVQLDPLQAIRPMEEKVEGYEISTNDLFRLLYIIPNELERYISLLSRYQYPMERDGLAMSGQEQELWLIDLSILNRDAQERIFSEVLQWAQEHSDLGLILYEIRKTGEQPSLLLGRISASGEPIKEVGSIFDLDNHLALGGAPHQWHARKIPGWPMALEQGIPTISCVMEQDSDWEIFLLLKRLYGRRFQKSLVILNDHSINEIPEYVIFQRSIATTSSLPKTVVSRIKDKEKLQGELFWNINQKKDQWIPDYLWDSDYLRSEFFAEGLEQATYGWSFCYMTLYSLGLEKKIWVPLFQKGGILGKIPMHFPNKELIQSQKWQKFWAKQIGNARLEHISPNFKTFWQGHWVGQGNLAQLLAYHSLLPLQSSRVADGLLWFNMPMKWHKFALYSQENIPKRIEKWPFWHKKIQEYRQLERKMWYLK